MAGNWIKVYRSLMDSSVWPDEWLVKLWIWCLMKANYSDRQWKEITINRGQFVTGQNRGAEELDVSPARWYRGMKSLESFGNITMKSNNHFTVVTVINYSTYQDDNDDERIANELLANSQRIASELPTNSQRIQEKKERREEVKKEKKERKEVASLVVVFPESLSTEEFKAAWADWEAHRKEIKHPITPTSRKAQLSKLAAMGCDRAIKAIRHTIEQGWQGIYEATSNGNGKPAKEKHYPKMLN